MRWKNRGPTEFLSEKTFLVIKDNLNVFDGGSSSDFCGKSKNKTGEICNTASKTKQKSATSRAGTWPPKIKKKPSASSTTSIEERPKTANLELPNFLDPRLVDKLDMSMLSKELLLDSMTHIQLANGGVGVGGIERRRQSLNIPSCPSRRDCNRLGRTSFGRLGYNSSESSTNSGVISLARQKRKSFEPVTDSELSYHNRRDTSPDIRVTMKKQTGRSSAVQQGVVGSNETIVVKRLNTEGRSSRDDNNNHNNNNNNNNNKRISATSLTPKISALTIIAKKKSSTKSTAIKSDVEVFTGAIKTAPEPCKTCGRSDQPERFHSHPKNVVPVKIRESLAAAAAAVASAKPKVGVQKTIQKPVALNFRSEKRNKGSKIDTSNIGVGNNQPEKPQSASITSPKRGPRSVTCYICSREFGTASFPIHEPKCLQRWERENNALPPSQRRPAPPQRPEVLPSDQGWNKAAWEQSQAQLLPCSRCGRTFLPDRLPVHEKSCKAQKKNPEQKEAPQERIRVAEGSGGLVGASGGSGTTSVIPSREPPMVFCQICGRSFGSRSIKIHEPQCLKRWQSENDGLPPPQRKKEPAAGAAASPPSAINSSSTFQEIQIPQKKTVPCYICGRDFGSTSIAIHEPQCLKKWHQENDKLPPGQRRQQPEKPDIVFTRDGTGAEVVDYAATAEANWRSHLGQLVPCKLCGRTFNPDRVAVHERGCKGNR